MFDERDNIIEAIAAELRQTPDDMRAAKAHIMVAVQLARPEGQLAASWRWLRTARTVRFSPLVGLAVAAGVTMLIAWSSLSRRPVLNEATPSSVPVATASTPTSLPRVVQFVLVAPAASHVSLVGDFNGWDAQATPLLQASGKGVWAVEVPLAPGRHAYAFVVDDSTWMADPAAARAPGDDFGAPSSVLVVEGGTT